MIIKHKFKCRIAVLLLFISTAHEICAKKIFPFNEVNKKWNISINGGYNHSAKVGLYGFGLTIKGFHVTIGGTGSTHENDVNVAFATHLATHLVTYDATSDTDILHEINDL